MMVAIDISISMGFLSGDFKEKTTKLFRRLKLPYVITGLDTEGIISSLKFDKKFTEGKSKYILLKGINKPLFYYDIDPGVITNSINNCINNIL